MRPRVRDPINLDSNAASRIPAGVIGPAGAHNWQVPTTSLLLLSKKGIASFDLVSSDPTSGTATSDSTELVHRVNHHAYLQT